MLLGIPLPPLPQTQDGATPVAQAVATQQLLMLAVLDDMDDAGVADEIISGRLAGGRSSVTGEPYASRIAEPRVTVLDGDDRAVVMLTATLVYGSSDWLDILSARDLGFAFWLPEE